MVHAWLLDHNMSQDRNVFVSAGQALLSRGIRCLLSNREEELGGEGGDEGLQPLPHNGLLLLRRAADTGSPLLVRVALRGQELRPSSSSIAACKKLT